MKLLERSDINEAGANTRKALERFERSYDSCQLYAQNSPRFRFLLKKDKNSNHTVYADIFYIESKPVWHIANESKIFQLARRLSNMSSQTLWMAL